MFKLGDKMSFVPALYFEIAALSGISPFQTKRTRYLLNLTYVRSILRCTILTSVMFHV